MILCWGNSPILESNDNKLVKCPHFSFFLVSMLVCVVYRSCQVGDQRFYPDFLLTFSVQTLEAFDNKVVLIPLLSLHSMLRNPFITSSLEICEVYGLYLCRALIQPFILRWGSWKSIIHWYWICCSCSSKIKFIKVNWATDSKNTSGKILLEDNHWLKNLSSVCVTVKSSFSLFPRFYLML